MFISIFKVKKIYTALRQNKIARGFNYRRIGAWSLTNVIQTFISFVFVFFIFSLVKLGLVKSIVFKVKKWYAVGLKLLL